MNNADKDEIDPSPDVLPWFVHHQSHKLVLCGKHKTLTCIRRIGEVETFQRLCEQYGGEKRIAGSTKVFSAFYAYLSEETKQQIIPMIDVNDFLPGNRSDLNARRRDFQTQQRKKAILEHLASSSYRKIILVKQSSLLDQEIHDGIWQYINKHGRDVCAFATTEDEVAVLAEKKSPGSLSLVIMSHWDPDWSVFSIWSHGVDNIGRAIGSMLNRLPQIAALRLIACNAGQLDQQVMETPSAIKNPECAINRTVTFIREYKDQGIPFVRNSLAREIWDNVDKQENREFSLSASSAYMVFFKGHFVGSEHCTANVDPVFTMPDDLSSSKTICITTPHGLKAPRK